MSLEKVIEILRDADIETVGCTGIEARIDNIDGIAERIIKLFAIPDVSKQRELLIAFTKYKEEAPRNIITQKESKIIDDFLSNL